MAKLHARVRERRSLGAADAAAMYALYHASYEATSRARFERDLAGKDHVIELREGDVLRGFSTLEVLRLDVAGGPCNVLFSGDTVIERDFWGEHTLALAFCEFAGRLKAAQPQVPLYWFLISKGYRTYRYLSVYARRYFPHHGEPTPPAEQRLLDAMARHKFREAYDPAAGLVRFPQSQGHLRDALSGVRDGLLERPEVRFFLERNPRYAQGEELACMTELAAANLRSHALRAFEAGHAAAHAGA
jgi:hypothetical protein